MSVSTTRSEESANRSHGAVRGCLRAKTNAPMLAMLISGTMLCNGLISVNLVACGVQQDLPHGCRRGDGLTQLPAGYVVSQGEALVVRNGARLALPLLHTAVHARIDGFLARVNVTQTFVNPLDTVIEALYAFPLPENSAVDSMVMTIGAKRIRGAIKERGEARAIYEQARREGKTASLLEQERPNIFTQSVANILPGDTILVAIGYVQEVTCRNAIYSFNFPMVVGPRYIPGTPISPAAHGAENPTNAVPDADKITPPILPPGTRSGHDISLQLTLNPGVPFSGLSSPSHKTAITCKGDGTAVIELAANDRIPNKDFILDYTVAGNQIRDAILTHRDAGATGFVQLMLIPKLSHDEREIFPRELVFVVDNSGSMMGQPIEKCKEVMALCLSKMRRDDVFRLVKFSGCTGVLSPVALQATDENVRMALSYVQSMQGGGGTEMMRAIDAIFDAPQTAGPKRLVLFMTDGFVGNDEAIIAAIRARLGDSRVFSLGIGSSVNHYLLEGMASAGRGVCMTIRQDGDATHVMNDFYSLIDAPVLTDIAVTWQGIEPADMQPALLPDLFAGQPLAVIAKYDKPGSGVVTVTGSLPGGKRFERSVEIRLPEEQPANGALGVLWARRKIAETELHGARVFGDAAYTDPKVKEEVTKLGLAYRIMTKFTSFVAVDDAVRNRNGTWVPVEQAVEMPEGVSPLSQPDYRFAGSQCRSRVTRGGVLGIGQGICPGNALQSTGGMSMQIDALMGASPSGLSAKGGGGIGYGSGFAGGMGRAGSGGLSGLQKRLGGAACVTTDGISLSGGRARAEITKVVMMNLASLRYAYNKRLRDKPGLKGKLVVRFRIDEFGTVISCDVKESTINDPDLEVEVVSHIKRWCFGKIDKPGDITEVVYPFVFAP